MTDPYTDPNYQAPLSGYGTGILLPPIASAMSADPRRLLIQSLLESGRQAQARPMYSKFSALANALTSAAGPYELSQLNKQYQGLNQDYMDQLRQAYGANQPPTGPVPPVAPAVPSNAADGASPPAVAPIQQAPAPSIAPPQVALRQGDAAATAAAGLIPSVSPSATSAPSTSPALTGNPTPTTHGPLIANLEKQSGLPAPQIISMVTNAERQNGLPPGSLYGVLGNESSGIPRPGPPLPNGERAQGFGQWRADTATQYGVKPGDLSSEITGMGRYLGDLTKANGGNFSKALVDYGGFQTKDPSKYIAGVSGPPAGPGGVLPPSTMPQPSPAIGGAPQGGTAQLAQTLVSPQTQAPSASDPYAQQLAFYQRMLQSNNPFVVNQAAQSIQALRQGAALAFQKGKGEEEGKGAAALGPYGTAAQIAAKAPAEAQAEALKLSTTAGPAATAARLKAEAEAQGKAGYTLAERDVITPDGPQSIPMTDAQALKIALGQEPGVKFMPKPTPANAPIIADQRKTMLDPASKAYTDNENTKAAIQAMMELSKGITTGNLTPHIADINNALQNVGLPQINPQNFDANTAASLHKTLSQLVLNRIQTSAAEGGGTTSRGNMLLFRIIADTKPSLETPGPAIQGIGQNMLKMIDVDQARNKQLLNDATSAATKAQPLPSNWETNFWDQYNKNNPEWQTKFAQEFAQSVKPSAAATPSPQSQIQALGLSPAAAAQANAIREQLKGGQIDLPTAKQQLIELGKREGLTLQ